MIQCFIGVGSNLGEREENILHAEKILFHHTKIEFIQSAPVYETDPVDGPSQGKFLNTVWEIRTLLTPAELLLELLHIESKLGRARTSQKNEPRIIDLDLLLYGNEIIGWEKGKPTDTVLVVPHPKIQERWFVLKPLSDLRNDLIHPVTKKTVLQMLHEVK